MSYLRQHSGMADYVDQAEWDRREIEEFGEPVQLRALPDHFELYVGGVWYPCGLSDLDMSTDVESFIVSVKRLVENERQKQVAIANWERIGEKAREAARRVYE